MAKLPIPNRMVKSIYEISPEYLREKGIRLLLLDLDNTLSPYHIHEPTKALQSWIDSMKRADIEPFILSNNHGQRPAVFAGALGIDFVGRAGKPSIRVLRRVLEEKRVSAEAAILVGDQIYTDILCACRGGIRSICVRPISLRNPLLALRYWAEAPFRFAYKEKKR